MTRLDDVLLLALDTATPAVTVALHDGRDTLAESTTVDARRHGELLAPAIADVLRSAGADRGDLTDVAVGTGPGPFTGLRVGLVTARALADALDLRLHGMCTLDVLARAHAGTPVAVLTDARRREVYWACYGAAGERLHGPEVDRPAAVGEWLSAHAPAGLRLAGLRLAGHGALEHAGELPDLPVDAAQPYPSAAVLAAAVTERLAAGADTGPVRPLYLRRPDARPPGPRKLVTPA